MRLITRSHDNMTYPRHCCNNAMPGQILSCHAGFRDGRLRGEKSIIKSSYKIHRRNYNVTLLNRETLKILIEKRIVLVGIFYTHAQYYVSMTRRRKKTARRFVPVVVHQCTGIIIYEPSITGGRCQTSNYYRNIPLPG